MPDSLLEPEFEPHFTAWKKLPTPRTADSLLKALEPISRSALTTYSGSQASSPTLASKAKLIMLNALPKYDPSKSKLKTYMMSHLQSLRRATTREERILSAPEQVLLDLNHLHESSNQLKDKLGRDPSDIELADHTGLSKQRLNYIRTMRPAYAEGSLKRTNTDMGREEAFAPAVEQESSMPALLEFLYHDLDPMDQVILEHTMGIHRKPVLQNQELASKLRLSQGAISQRKARLQNKLDELTQLRLF